MSECKISIFRDLHLRRGLNHNQVFTLCVHFCYLILTKIGNSQYSSVWFPYIRFNEYLFGNSWTVTHGEKDMAKVTNIFFELLILLSRKDKCYTKACMYSYLLIIWYPSIQNSQLTNISMNILTQETGWKHEFSWKR